MRSYWILFTAILVTVQMVCAAPEKTVFRAGAAKTNITPFLGGNIVGNFIAFPSSNVHDEVHARCVVLDDGKTKLALVVCDLLNVSRDLCNEASRLVEKNTGIPADHVLISAVHTHSGCVASGNAPLTEYQKLIVRRIADAVQIALNTLRPAQMAFVTADAPEYVFNRRWIMKPGTAPPNPFGGIDAVKMNPNAASPNLVEPAGPTDPAVSVIALREPNGRPIAVYSAYSLHYVGGTRPGDISADYYGMYCERLKELLSAREQDPPFVAMMANGTSGDINSVNYAKPIPAEPPYVKMRRIADDIAQRVRTALANAEYRGDVTLAAKFRGLKLAARRPSSEQVEWAKKVLAQPKPEPGKVNLPYIYAGRVTRMAAQRAPDFDVPLHVFRIGPVCIGSMPVEVFCETGLAFKKRSPCKPAFMVELAHGALGYLPTPRHYELGGYETWLGSSNLEPQASEKMLDAVLEMAAEVKEPETKK